MGLPARFTILKKTTQKVVIQDMGPWTNHYTVTNDAENVVKRLLESKDLRPGQRLFYYDSDGDPGELVLNPDGQFSHFGFAQDIES